jgi:hypothetical protein
MKLCQYTQRAYPDLSNHFNELFSSFNSKMTNGP